MTQLVELPSNNGQVFAVDPHLVTGVQGYRATLHGRGNELHDVCAVWVKPPDGGTTQVFVCAWPVQDTVTYLNNHRQAQANLFGAGYRAGVADGQAGSAGEDTLRTAWAEHLRSERSVTA